MDRFESYIEGMLSGENEDACLLILVQNVSQELDIKYETALDMVIDYIDNKERALAN